MSFGSYELGEEIGRGAMGRVFRARHLPTGAVRALKVLATSADPEAVTRFRREVEALARVGGRGVVPIHESGLERGQLWFAMELMTGGSLRARLRREGKLPWREAVLLARELALVLARCHAARVIHRDVKPDNVLLDAAGAPWLADFGVVRDLGASRLTETGAAVGTVAYMAPEQLLGEPIDGGVDVFALGVLLHELVAGSVPFERKDVVGSALGRGRARPRLAALGAPRELDRVLDGALAMSRADRATAEKLASGLDDVLQGVEPPGRGLVVVLVGLAATSVAGVAVALAMRAAPATVEATLARGLAALEIARKEGDAAPVTSSGDVALERARASADEARRDRRATAAERDAAARLLAQAALVEAERDVKAGRFDAALEAVAALDAREPPVIALKARVHEARGEERLAAGDFAGAKAAFTGALELRPDDRVRARRGSAAAAAGDDALALDDLKALHVDWKKVTREDARRDGRDGLAPALYRFAMKQGDERRSDLEHAWRLADPPAEIAQSIADFWAEDAEKRVMDFLYKLGKGSISETETAVLRAGFELGHRAYVLAPDGAIKNYWNSSHELVGWGIMSDENSKRLIDAFADWPDQPVAAALAARAAEKREDWTACLAAAQNGLRHLPRSVPVNEDEVRYLTEELSWHASQAWSHGGKGEDRELLFRAAEASRSVLAWSHLGRAWFRPGHDPARARDCMERARKAENPIPAQSIPIFTELQVLVLESEGRREELIAALKETLRDGYRVDVAWPLVQGLEAGGRWSEILDLPRPSRADLADSGRRGMAVGVVVRTVRAFCELHRRPEAEALAKQCVDEVPTSKAELDAVLAAYPK